MLQKVKTIFNRYQKMSSPFLLDFLYKHLFLLSFTLSTLVYTWKTSKVCKCFIKLIQVYLRIYKIPKSYRYSHALFLFILYSYLSRNFPRFIGKLNKVKKKQDFFLLKIYNFLTLRNN